MDPEPSPPSSPVPPSQEDRLREELVAAAVRQHERRACTRTQRPGYRP